MPRSSSRLESASKANSAPKASTEAKARNNNASTAKGDREQTGADATRGTKNLKREREESSTTAEDQNNKKRVKTLKSGGKSATRKQARKAAAAGGDRKPSVNSKPGAAPSGSRCSKTPARKNVSAPAAGKKAGKKVVEIRENFGVLEKFLKAVPLEILLEVFCHVEPLDLLHLSRVCKDFRDLLWSKASSYVWRATRENMDDLPPIPDGISEPRYARLMYEGHCDGCNRPTENFVWQYHMRCCKICERNLFITSDYFTGKGKISVTTFDAIVGLIPSHWIRGRGGDSEHLTEAFLLDDVEYWVDEYEAVARDPVKEARWLNERERCQEALEQHVELCKQWYERQLAKRAKERELLREKRREDILAKLGKIGWGDEARKIIANSNRQNDDGYYYTRRFTHRDEEYDDFSTHTLVKQVKQLTDEEWETIAKPLVSFLQCKQTARIERERVRALTSRYDLVREMYSSFCKREQERESPRRVAYPKVQDLYVSQMLDDIIWTTPADQKLIKEDFKPFFENEVRGFVEEWRAGKERDLLGVLRRSLELESEPGSNAIVDSDPALKLATTLFECTFQGYECNKPLLYPDIIDHFQNHWHSDVNPRERSLNTLGYSYSDVVDVRVYNPCPGYTTYSAPMFWDAGLVGISVRGVGVMRRILEGCGLDPGRATVEELEGVDPLVECDRCSEGMRKWKTDGSRYFFRWASVLGLREHDETHQVTVSVFESEVKENMFRSAKQMGYSVSYGFHYKFEEPQPGSG